MKSVSCIMCHGVTPYDNEDPQSCSLTPKTQQGRGSEVQGWVHVRKLMGQGKNSLIIAIK